MLPAVGGIWRNLLNTRNKVKFTPIREALTFLRIHNVI